MTTSESTVGSNTTLPNAASSSTPSSNITGISSISSTSGLAKRSYGPIVITLENVLLPPEKLDPSPSLIDGLDKDTEIFLRVGGCELIQTSGILLKLPQTAMATGQVLFQRFYYSKSFVRQPMEVTAMACIYLASKIEEAPRRIRDVINVFHHIRQIRSGKLIQPLILDQSYVRLKSDVVLVERRVLKELGFNVHVKHPHKIIVIYLQQLNFDKDRNFVQMSWNYMNDALRTNVFVRFTPEAIACACIFLSARMLKIPLPTSPSWYLVFDVTDDDVTEIATNILSLYERDAINYDELEKKVDVIAKAYQEMREKGRSSILSAKKDEKIDTTPTASSKTPESKTSTPRLPDIIPVSSEKGKDRETRSDKSKYSSDVKERLNGDVADNSLNKKKDQEQHQSRLQPSSPAKRVRRSPSPIIFNDRDQGSSPTRHKHKKRKKSKYSVSRSRSRSPRERAFERGGDRGRNRNVERHSTSSNSKHKSYYRSSSPSSHYKQDFHRHRHSNSSSSSNSKKDHNRYGKERQRTYS